VASTSHHPGAIAGGVVGGLVGLMVFGGLFFLVFRARRALKRRSPSDEYMNFTPNGLHINIERKVTGDSNVITGVGRNMDLDRPFFPSDYNSLQHWAPPPDPTRKRSTTHFF